MDDGNASSFINLYVQVFDLPDHNDSENEGGDWNQTEESGHPIFDLNESALHELAGDWLPAGPYALVEMNGSILDLEPVFLDPNGTWFPTPSSDYLNLVPGRYGLVSEVFAWFEGRGYEPIGYLPFDHPDGNHTDSWDENRTAIPIYAFDANQSGSLTDGMATSGYYVIEFINDHYVGSTMMYISEVLEDAGYWYRTFDQTGKPRQFEIAPGFPDRLSVEEWLAYEQLEPIAQLLEYQDGNYTDPWDDNHSERQSIELLLSNHIIAENLPVGSLIGHLEIISDDSNYNYDSNLTLKLMKGNPSFVLEEGALLSNEVFDYEELSGHLVVVGVFGPEGLLYEREFTIRIIDRFQPIVRTLAYLETESHGFSLGGNLLDEGEGTAFIETGILLSGHPEPSFDDNESLILISDSNGSGPFEIFVDDLLPGLDYYYRAYAANAEGISFGSTHRLRTPKPSDSPEWSDALPLGDGEGWWQSPWFGSFFMGDHNGWIMHEKLGWLFVLPQEDSVWLWQDELGWLWTARGTYPIYSKIVVKTGFSITDQMVWNLCFSPLRSPFGYEFPGNRPSRPVIAWD